MTAPLPDPRLRKVMTELDETKRLLMREKMRASNYAAQLRTLKAQRTNDAKPAQREQRPGC